LQYVKYGTCKTKNSIKKGALFISAPGLIAMLDMVLFQVVFF